MKVIRTPEVNYFEGGWVKFSTKRKGGELYYTIDSWNRDKSYRITIEQGKVKDKDHLKELKCMEEER